jgi:hypothetical protein
MSTSVGRTKRKKRKRTAIDVALSPAWDALVVRIICAAVLAGDSAVVLLDDYQG